MFILSAAVSAYMELYERADAGEKVTLVNPKDLYAAADDVGNLIRELRAKGYGLCSTEERTLDATLENPNRIMSKMASKIQKKPPKS